MHERLTAYLSVSASYFIKFFLTFEVLVLLLA